MPLFLILVYPFIEILMPVAVAIVFIALMSLVREPARQQIMVLIIAGAGATYISGSEWESGSSRSPAS